MIGTAPVRAVGLRSWNALRNLGDAVTAWIVRDLLGHSPVAVAADVPHVLGTGSHLFMATPASRIWGTGVLDPRRTLPPIRPDQIAALRGVRTVSALRERGLDLPATVPLGDPGVLVRHLPEVRAWQAEAARRGPRFRAALVPHWSSVGHPFFTGFPGLGDDVVLVDPRDDTLAPLRALLDAEVVLSQALHGLIFAEALGKPSLWIAEGDDPAARFKFDDWYTNVADPPDAPLPFAAVTRDAFGRARPRTPRVDEAALLAAFPAAATGLDAPDLRVSFDLARRVSPHRVEAAGLLHVEPRRLDHLPADEVRRLSGNLDAALAGHYRGWAERPVTLLIRPGWSIPDGLARRLRNFLEHYESGSLAVVSQAQGWRFPDIEGQRWRDWIVVPGLRLLGDALLLRPDVPAALEGRMDTVFVPH
ncbi:hypothetical protein [Muricoccus radiodurans]|uniref:hypothetical protein n=1 Tax=Muricoccus radiodurans TaxID=2231721 RepID=UPI003CED9402